MTVDEFVGDFIGDVSHILVLSPDTAFLRKLDETTDVSIIVVSEDDGDVELPLKFDKFEDRVLFGVEGSLENELVEDGDNILCIDQVFDKGSDTLAKMKVSKSMRTGLYDLFINSKAEADVIRDVVKVAVELGKKGQKGEPVGALFVVGDAGKVMDKSRPLAYNPFEKSHVHVGDPIVNVMLKEFSRLDGAFVISDSGKIVSAYRYLEPNAEGIDIPKGLGTRHMAGASITRDTNAISVVLSESDKLVRVFKGGKLILELDPEEY